MPFPGPIPDTPWKLMPPSTGVPYFRYVQKGTPSTYGDSPDGGSQKLYSFGPAILTGAAACALVWGAKKYGGRVAVPETYMSAFATAAGSRILFDGLYPFIAGHGVVEGVKTMVTTQPKHTFALLAVGVVAPIVAVVAEAKASRGNRR